MVASDLVLNGFKVQSQKRALNDIQCLRIPINSFRK